MDMDSISWVRDKMPEKMAREMFWQSAQYFEPLGKLVGLWHALDLSQNHDQRIQALQLNLDIQRPVDWKDADGFCVLLGGLFHWLTENPLQLTHREIRLLTEEAIDVAESSNEMIQDGANWQMGIDDLRSLLEPAGSSV